MRSRFERCHLKGRSRLGLVLPLSLALWLLAPVGARAQKPPRPPASTGELGSWAEGPVRWLLLPAERQDLAKASSPAEALGFVERFWARRDPDPATPINPFRDTFYQRVEAADLLYRDDGDRGSLTVRGRALILLGSPTGLRVTNYEALEWDPSAGTPDNVRVRQLPMEIWSYQPGDLPVSLRQALAATDEQAEYRVSFVRDERGMSLREGEELLDLALRTALALGREE